MLDHMLLACLLENSTHEAAERAFATLKKDYFDLNEVRVSTARELSEGFDGLTDPLEAADRLKRSLHSAFESVYAFDVEMLKKQNIGQAVKTLEEYDGTTPFVVSYVTQNALGGHSIALNKGLFVALETLGVISDVEAAKGVAPGLERAVPKAKGVEVASLLHQLGVEVGRNPYGQPARKLLLEIDPTCKSRLPKRPVKVVPPPPEPPPEKKAKSEPPKLAASKAKPAGKSASSKSASSKSTSAKKPDAKKSKAEKPKPKKSPLKSKVVKGKAVKGKSKPAKPKAKKKPAKTIAKKKPAKKKPVKKTKGKKTTSRRLSKKKPR